tara:strand:- start:943 stop:1083 length:141 start_codon:yes stop_codon:yes gene_type:complete
MATMKGLMKKGNLTAKGNFKKGKEEDIWESYYENVQLWYKVNTKNG